tara:strand:+ start:71 stop:337 length:267 start_codon:yes stop_codon:yes gene_type:complete
MKVQMIPMSGIRVRALVVDQNTPHRKCENCSKPCYDHPDLVKDDIDWCINCNDEHYRGHMDDFEMGMWTMKQMSEGKIVIVVTEDEPE